MRKSELRKLIIEELIKEMPNRIDPAAAPTQVKSATDGQVAKIGQLAQVKQLMRRLPSRPAAEMADTIMALIDVLEEKTNDPKSKLVTRELILKLREKLKR